VWQRRQGQDTGSHHCVWVIAGAEGEHACGVLGRVVAAERVPEGPAAVKDRVSKGSPFSDADHVKRSAVPSLAAVGSSLGETGDNARRR
jgi:hypothetical protein